MKKREKEKTSNSKAKSSLKHSKNRSADMKYILVVGDGMADYPVPELENKTPLQAAYKPNMDSITAKGRSGLIKNVPDKMAPGSETAICSVLGYNPTIYCTGRGPLEAPSRGITLSENDTAYRCNLITEKTVQSPVFPFGAATTINLCHRFAAGITSLTLNLLPILV